jgi:hypothetical protein
MANSIKYTNIFCTFLDMKNPPHLYCTMDIFNLQGH